MEFEYIDEKKVQKTGLLDESFCNVLVQAILHRDYKMASDLYLLAGNIAIEEAETWKDIAKDIASERDIEECRLAMAELYAFLYENGSNHIAKSTILLYLEKIYKSDAKKINKFADYYMKTVGVLGNHKKAMKLYGHAAELGNCSAMCNLGSCYFYGLGTGVNLDEAYKWYERAFKNGSTLAIRFLAIFYMNGLCVHKDPEKAVGLFVQAAEKGDISSMLWLGKYYYAGQEVEKDPLEAFKWFERANRGNPQALRYLGACYEYGFGVLQDYAKAFEFYMQAYEKGDPDASLPLGNHYINGLRSEENDLKAISFYLEAIKNGSLEVSQEAARSLGEIYKTTDSIGNKLREHFDNIRQSADEGNPEANYFIGLCFEYGILQVMQDISKAVVYYWKAANLGHKNAKLSLNLEKLSEEQALQIGLKYLLGDELNEVSKNCKIAATYLFEAAIKGNSLAVDQLVDLYENGEGFIKDQEEISDQFFDNLDLVETFVYLED